MFKLIKITLVLNIILKENLSVVHFNISWSYPLHLCFCAVVVMLFLEECPNYAYSFLCFQNITVCFVIELLMIHSILPLPEFTIPFVKFPLCSNINLLLSLALLWPGVVHSGMWCCLDNWAHPCFGLTSWALLWEPGLGNKFMWNTPRTGPVPLCLSASAQV